MDDRYGNPGRDRMIHQRDGHRSSSSFPDAANSSPSTPAMERARFPGISHRAYEHPSALTALTALKRVKGFDLMLKWLHSMVGEPVVRMQHLTSAVRVGPRQFRRLHVIKEEAGDILDIGETPELYVRKMGEVNAFTVGMDRPFIVISTDLLDLLDENELRFVIGHELGHAISGHSLYLTMARIIASAGLGSFPVAGLALDAAEAALMDWSRKSELSCDRAGLLVTQDFAASIRTLMKLAAGSHFDEMNVAEFMEQAAEYELDAGGVRNRIYKYLLPSGTHPILVLRAAELDRWVRRGEYARVVEQRQYPLRSKDSSATVRDTLRQQLEAGKETRRQKATDRILRRSAPSD
ncbi:M48 family metallopeptidase, partial [Frankia sp. Cj5]|uniref:M48 family metallopeptidase n=1 Tax=Frankia sp. Cj5 TaxID=2880978 RepID=UPI001EF6FD80